MVGPDLHPVTLRAVDVGDPNGRMGPQHERSTLHVLTRPNRRASRAADELPQVVAALSRAFFEDRIWRWLVPDDAQRRRARGPSIRSSRRRAGRTARSTSRVRASEPRCGYRRASHQSTKTRRPTSSKPFLPAPVAPTPLRAWFSCSACSTSIIRPNPCWYLPFMGVDPAYQGQGIGSALVAVVLAKADRDGEPAYLEASSPENRRLYERHGFQTIGGAHGVRLPADLSHVAGARRDSGVARSDEPNQKLRCCG